MAESDRPVSVLIVDDSALMRNVIEKIIESSEGLEVAGKAMNGSFALQKLERLHPEVIVLDLEMPEMNGIEFLQERKKRGIEIPVVILSSVAKKGARVTMDAISLGASDFIMKPSAGRAEEMREVGQSLAEMLRGYGHQFREGKPISPEDLKKTPPPKKAKPATPEAPPPKEREEKTAKAAKQKKTAGPPAAVTPKQEPAAVELLAIGISTGGPNALRRVFADIDPDLPVPVVVVQHMPAGFTEEFAKSLDRICPLDVKEAEDGDLLKAGRVLIAPGDYHLEVEKRSLASVVRVVEREPVNGHRPSVDVLFASVARHFGNHALAVIMTGMGRDGAKEIGTIYGEGGWTLGQDEESSVVYGMPKVAFDSGYIRRVEPLQHIAEALSEIISESQ
ncbi:MAG: chemotaxis-specific protein-glutamate methyltransferase CheB [Spirochaetales bacterium]|nr:chemotaxis-specific protein-glutamate methyltransferase CheB [Spirochaetales bacterium]MCF7939267.1 chemotaxis-specific protein-glutamate methyltransferase CheB [Spirochaetales bacterium]